MEAPDYAGANPLRLRLAAGGDGGLNASKGRVQIGAESLDDRDEGDRNTGGDQAIFDGGRTRFFFQKAPQQLGHGVDLQCSIYPLSMYFSHLLLSVIQRIKFYTMPLPVRRICPFAGLSFGGIGKKT